MPMKNRIKEFVDAREPSVYAFWQKTGISRTTAYDLYHNSDTYPGKNVMDAICQAYDVQPGDLIYWEPPSGDQQDD